MKKLTLLCTRASREETLAALRGLGVIHLHPVRAPEGNDLDEARGLLEHLSRALELLPKHPHAEPSGQSPHEVVKAIWDGIHRRQELESDAELLKQQIRRFEPFGDFSPELVHELAEQGVSVQLCALPLKNTPPVPEGVQRIELGRDRTRIYAALVFRGEVDVEVETVPLPERSLDAMRNALAGLERELDETAATIERYAGDRAAVAGLADGARDRVRYLEARAGMGDADEVVWLRGYFPADRADEMRTLAAERGWGALIDDPSPDDPVPTLLRNPKWVETIRPLLDMVNLTPGYHETDISPAFLVFFCIFYGMLVGDAGYGLLFLAVTLFCRFRFKRAPRPLFNLLTVTSLATVVWGAISGVWFGVEHPPQLLQALHWSWLDEYSNVMGLCFLLGAVHLTLAHGWQMVLKWGRPAAWAEAGWIGSTWAMFFIAAQMICGWPMPAFTLPLLGVSAGLIILFMTPLRQLKAHWIRHAMLPLDVINNFVDVVSYLRLFAVGLATLEVARAFNGMAGGAPALLAALILFAGHAMNIAMALMGVMVHGLRLNALEFSNHVGLEWAGFEYDPFVKTEKGGDE